MPVARLQDVSLFYEEAGTGFPLVLCHEFGGSMESWKAQVSFFSRRYRLITYNARGYPPSDVPSDPAAYSEEQAVEDLYQMLRSLGIAEAYVGGISMGATAALHFGRLHPEMARALIIAAAGTGSTEPERFRGQSRQLADELELEGMDALRDYASGPTRVQLRRKDPTGWREFADLIQGHSPLGSALTLRGVQAARLPIFASEQQIRRIEVPALILVGDEDDPCIEPSIFLKRTLPRSGLVVFPQSGHAINLEEPQLFNRVVADFLSAVEAGKWSLREKGSGGGFLANKDA